ncbi:DUF3459 domain-containing protein, partial [Burkholderia gladioli]
AAAELAAATARKAARDDGAAPRALVARWRLGNGAGLTIALNLEDRAIALPELPPGKIVFETPPRVRDSLGEGRLDAHACLAWLDAPADARREGHGR